MQLMKRVLIQSFFIIIIIFLIFLMTEWSGFKGKVLKMEDRRATLYVLYSYLTRDW